MSAQFFESAITRSGSDRAAKCPTRPIVAHAAVQSGMTNANIMKQERSGPMGAAEVFEHKPVHRMAMMHLGGHSLPGGLFPLRSCHDREEL